MGKALIDKGWSKMESTLEKELPNKKYKKRAILIFFSCLTVISLTLAFCLSQLEAPLQPESDYTTSVASIQSIGKISPSKTNDVQPIVTLSKNDVNKSIPNHNLKHDNDDLQSHFKENQIIQDATTSKRDLSINHLNHQLGLLSSNPDVDLQLMPNIDKSKNQDLIESQGVQLKVTSPVSLTKTLDLKKNEIKLENHNLLIDNQSKQSHSIEPNHANANQLQNTEAPIIVNENNVVSQPLNSTIELGKDLSDDDSIEPLVTSKKINKRFNLFTYIQSSDPLQIDGGGLGLSYFMTNKSVKPYAALGIDYLRTPENIVINSLDENKFADDVTVGVNEATSEDLSLSKKTKSTLTSISPFISLGLRWQLSKKLFIDNEITLSYDISKINNGALPFIQDQGASNYQPNYENYNITKTRLTYKTNHKLGFNVNNRLSLLIGYQIALSPEFNFKFYNQSKFQQKLNRFNLGVCYNI